MSRCLCLMVLALLAIAGIVVGQTPSPTVECQSDNIGDGVCDPVTNNNEECGYDDGDCCECTCESDASNDNGCITFDCLDPEAECFGDTPSPSVTLAPAPSSGATTTDDDDSSAPLVVSSPRAATIILGLAALLAILIPLR